MSLLLIDDEGEIWRGDSRQLRISFDSPYSGGEFCEYAVKNLGFVAINMYGASCQLRLRPKFVGEKTYKALTDWLSRGRLQRVVLSIFDKQWRDELVQAKSVLARLAALVCHEQNDHLDTYLARRILPSAISSDSRLADIVRAWPNIASGQDDAVAIRLARAVLGDRYVVLERPANQDRIVFKEFGSKMYEAYQDWRGCAVGAPIEEQPDRGFGRWVGAAYRDAAQQQSPTHDEIDVIVEWPHAGRCRHRYQRLIFPLPPRSSGQLLLGGSIVDAAVDLRVSI